MIGNWMRKLLTQSILDIEELHLDAHNFYQAEEVIYIIGGSSLVHAVFRIINPEARIKNRYF